MSNVKILGKRIKEIRENNNFSQSNIAAFLEVDQSLISKAEKDERSLTSDMIEKLATLFGVQPKEFMSEDPVDPLAYAFRASEMTAEDINTIYAINRIALNSKFLSHLLNGASVSNDN